MKQKNISLPGDSDYSNKKVKILLCVIIFDIIELGRLLWQNL